MKYENASLNAYYSRLMIIRLHPPRAVIALQLLQIREARLLNLDSFAFEERQIPLKPTCGVMITMNPGYAGTPPFAIPLLLFHPLAPSFDKTAHSIILSVFAVQSSDA